MSSSVLHKDTDFPPLMVKENDGKNEESAENQEKRMG